MSFKSDKEVFMLNDKEKEKYNIIEKVVNGTMTRKEAMSELKKQEHFLDLLLEE